MAHIVVDPQNVLPALRALHGVNNGPVGYGTLVDVSHHYIAAGIPLVRLHDPNWPHPREVDIPQVFPDFDADPEEAASYRFGPTDDYIGIIARTGARIVYRLGVSIEHTPRKYFTAPPNDPAKWARICQGIIRHYNKGWADGLRLGVPYWEIWNEADLDERMWSGSYEQYLELYRHASVAVKAADPAARVGGPAVANCRGGRLEQFLRFCREEALPLDFVSWHAYRRSPAELADDGRFVRGLLERYGFGRHVESHLNEWNYVDFDWNEIWRPGHEVMRRDSFQRQKNQVGASFAAAALILMQDAGVDVACYYDGQPSALFCGLFDYYGVPQKTFHSFCAFNRMLKYPRRIGVSIEGSSSLAALACADDEHGMAVLLSNFSDQSCACEVLLRRGEQEQRPTSLSVQWIDSVRTPVDESQSLQCASLEMPAYSVALVRVE